MSVIERGTSIPLNTCIYITCNILGVSFWPGVHIILIRLFSVFTTVMLSKKIETIEYRTSRILEMKEDNLHVWKKPHQESGLCKFYFICDMYSEKCFLQIVNLSTGFLTRFLIGGKSFGVGRELEKTYPATCMHWIESVSSYREGLCRGMPPGKILKSGPLRVHFQHSGAKIRVCEQKIDIIKFWFLGVPLRGTKISMHGVLQKHEFIAWGTQTH